MSTEDVLRDGRPDLQPWIDTGIVKEVTEAEGTGLVGAHAAGGTTLTVAAGGFREAGQCQVGEDVYTYTREGDSLDIDPPLVSAAEDGEPVLSLTPDGKVETARVAVIDLDGSGDPDDDVHATISGDLAGFYPLGLAAAGSIVRVEDTTYGYRVAGRPLDAPLLSAETLDPATGPTGLPSLQDLYDQANANAAAAAEAEYMATVAQATADGKNTVTYSNSTPGSTPNRAGDIWFQRDGTPSGGIIAQWEGQGGTSWASRQLKNEVIANLDAGKITVGTAFTNALHVKTNFTLGDAAVNGVIQSYNFAGSPVGVYIDKFGLVAKGGSVAGATITGGTVEGATIQTASSGTRVKMSSGSAGQVEFYYSGSLVGTVAAKSGTIGLDHANGTRFVDVTATRVLVGGGMDVSGGLDVSGGITGDLTGDVTGDLTGDINGGPTISGTVTMGSLGGSGGSSFVMVGNSGVLSRGAPSSLRYKENVRSLDARVSEALLQVDTITWQYKDREHHGDRTYAGVPAEQLHDLGLGLFVDYDEDGRPDQVRYWELTAPLIALCQQQQAQIDNLRERLEAAGL